MSESYPKHSTEYDLEQLVSRENIERWATVRGDQARQWLAELPALVAEYAQNWELVIDGPLDGGTVCAVIAVEQDDKPEVLKIHPPWLKPTSVLDLTSAETEAAAFRIWNGTCAPRLVANDNSALLLERIMQAEPLQALNARDIADLTQKIAHPKGMGVGEFIESGIPPLDQEVWKRYHRANAERHEKISNLLLMRAANIGTFISSYGGMVDYRHGWEMVHGDLKPKNILRRPDGSLAVIDPSPAFGGGLYDVALWVIDKPEEIEDRCLEMADYLQINVQVLGRLAMALAISEICLASPARADATLAAVHEITGATNLEAFFDVSYLEKDFMEERYTVIRVPGKNPGRSQS